MNFFTVENPSLYNGLAHIINLVKEQVNPIHVFQMNKYSSCVLGSVTQRPMHYGVDSQVVEELFGIVGAIGDNNEWLNSMWLCNNKDLEEDVVDTVRLFTDDIGIFVTYEYWLELAEKQLRKLEAKQ